MLALFDLVLRWLSGETVLVRTRRTVYLGLAVSLLSLASAIALARGMTRSLRAATELPKLPADSGDLRFGLPLAVRQDIFRELAAAEPAAREEGRRSFSGPNLAWSAEDHRGAFERKKVATIMSSRRLSMTQVYLVLDEGIRAKWPGPDGEPLTPQAVPLRPRRDYGW